MSRLTSFRILCVVNPSHYFTGKRDFEHVVLCKSLHETLRQIYRPDVSLTAILIHHHLPQISGFDFVHCLRITGYSGQIWVTADEMNNRDFLTYRQLGVNCFLYESFTFSLIQILLSQELSAGKPGISIRQLLKKGGSNFYLTLERTSGS